MSKLGWLLAGIILAAGAAAAQPTIYAITNAATYAPPGLPTSGLGQGSLFVVQGSGLAAVDASNPNMQVVSNSFPLTTSLNGTAIHISVGGGSADALIINTVVNIPSSVNPNYSQQVLALMPSNAPIGNGTAVVSFNGQNSAGTNITVAKSSFGAFTLNQHGTGPGVITTPSYGYITASTPAKPGDYVVVWGTGLGPTTHNETIIDPGTPENMTNSLSYSLLVGTQSVTPYYVGRSTFPGEDQVIFQVPAGVQGCFVNVILLASGAPSNTFSMAVSPDGSPCSDPNGFSATDMAGVPALQSGGTLKVGAISLTRNNVTLISANGATANVSSDTVTGNFGAYSWGQIIATQGPALAPSPGSCAVNNFKGLDPTPVDPITGTALNAGGSLTVTGPSESAKTAASTSTGVYNGLLGGLAISSIAKGSLAGALPDYLKTTGNFSVTGPGGGDVGGFSTQVSIPKPATWTTNISAMDRIQRSQPYTVSWTGADPNGFVSIVGISSTGGTFDPVKNTLVPNATTPGAAFLCVAPGGSGGAGSFTIPPAILESLPVSPDPSRIVIGAGFLLVGSSNAPVKFTATGLDAGYLTYRILTGKNVLYQ